MSAMQRNARQIERWSPWLLLVAVLVLWQIVCSGLGISEFIFPSPLRIWTQFWEFKEIIEEKRGFVLAHWDGTGETEQKVKEETKATIRLLPFEREEGKDLVSGRPGRTAVFARAY